jgi:hypothetical protein
MSTEVKRHDRRSFFRQVGKTVAVGFGIALIPVARASATIQSVYCCPDTSGQCPPSGCFPGSTTYYCPSINCCACINDSGCHLYNPAPC